MDADVAAVMLEAQPEGRVEQRQQLVVGGSEGRERLVARHVVAREDAVGEVIPIHAGLGGAV